MLYFGDGEGGFSWDAGTFGGIDSGAANVDVIDNGDGTHDIMLATNTGDNWTRTVPGAPDPTISAALYLTDESCRKDDYAQSEFISWLQGLGKFLFTKPRRVYSGPTVTAGIRG